MNNEAQRTFMVNGEEWIAWISGSGAYGTGKCGLGNVAAVHFARSAEPAMPVFEALLQAGGLDGLFEAELIALFSNARRVVNAADLPEGARRKVRSRSLQDHGAAPGESSG